MLKIDSSEVGGTISTIFRQVVKALFSIPNEVIEAPRHEEFDAVTESPMTYFQNCIGAIDGTHILFESGFILRTTDAIMAIKRFIDTFRDVSNIERSWITEVSTVDVRVIVTYNHIEVTQSKTEVDNTVRGTILYIKDNSIIEVRI